MQYMQVLNLCCHRGYLCFTNTSCLLMYILPIRGQIHYRYSTDFSNLNFTLSITKLCKYKTASPTKKSTRLKCGTMVFVTSCCKLRPPLEKKCTTDSVIIRAPPSKMREPYSNHLVCPSVCPSVCPHFVVMR